MKQSLPETICRIITYLTWENVSTTTMFSDLSIDRLDELDIIVSIEKQLAVRVVGDRLQDLGYNCHSVAEKLFVSYPELQDKYNMSELQDKVNDGIGVMKKYKEKPYLKNYWLEGSTELPKQEQKVKWNAVVYYFIGLNPIDTTFSVIQCESQQPNPKHIYTADLRPFTEEEVDALEAKPLTARLMQRV